MIVKGVPELVENHATFQDLWQFVFLKLVLLRVGMYAFIDLSRENKDKDSDLHCHRISFKLHGCVHVRQVCIDFLLCLIICL